MKSLGDSLENAIHNNINKLPFLHNFVREVLRLYCASKNTRTTKPNNT